MTTLIDTALLDAVCVEAAASPRRRKNRNLHESENAAAHRLPNAVQPDQEDKLRPVFLTMYIFRSASRNISSMLRLLPVSVAWPIDKAISHPWA